MGMESLLHLVIQHPIKSMLYHSMDMMVRPILAHKYFRMSELSLNINLNQKFSISLSTLLHLFIYQCIIGVFLVFVHLHQPYT